MRKVFLMGAAALLATSANATDWTGFSGTVTGGYNYANGSGVSSNAYNVGGAVNYAVPDSNLNVQGMVDYSENKALHVPADTWTSGGAITWRQSDMAFGFAGDYNTTNLYQQNLDYGTYGVFGEWYGNIGVNPITLRLSGGGITGTFAGLDRDGGYFGGGATYYVLPQFSLHADASYNTVSSLHWTTYELGATYLPVDTLPVTVSAAFVHDDIRNTGQVVHSDGLMVRLAWHLGEGNSLVDFDRNGPLKTHTAKLPVDGLTAINAPQ